MLLVLDGRLEEAELDLQGGGPPAVGEQHGGRQRRVVAHLTDRRHRVAEQPVVAEGAVLDHRQDDLRRPDLEERGDLGEVGVADDDVEPAVLLGVGVRLVAGVDDRTLQRRLQADLLLEEVGPLAQLERHRVVGGAGRLAADLAGAAEDLTGDEVRRDLRGQPPERRLAGHQVVLVAAVAVALAVRVVLVDDDLAGLLPRRPGGLGELAVRRVDADADDLLGGPVPPHRLECRRGLRVGDLRVGVIDVVAGPVGEHGVDE